MSRRGEEEERRGGREIAFSTVLTQPLPRHAVSINSVHISGRIGIAHCDRGRGPLSRLRPTASLVFSRDGTCRAQCHRRLPRSSSTIDTPSRPFRLPKYQRQTTPPIPKSIYSPILSLSLSLPIPPISSFVRPARDGPWWAGSSRTLLQPLSSPTSFYLQPLQINEIAATGTTRFSILLFDSIVEKNRSSASAGFDSNFGRVFLAPRKGFRDSWIFNAGPNAGHPFLLPRSSNERSPCLAFLPSAFDAFAPHARIYLDRGSISDLHRPPFPIIVVAIRSVSPRFFSFLPLRNREGEGGGAGDDRERVGDLATMMNREGSIIGVRGRSAAEKLASAGRAEKPQRNLRLGKTEGVAADG